MDITHCRTCGLWIKAAKDAPVGVKHDKEKSRVDLLSGPFLLSMGRIMGHGARRYGEANYQHVEKWRYVAAAGRHLYQYMSGEAVDTDSGESHLVCLAANCLILWEKERLEAVSKVSG